jgi:hypothetical protein
MATLKLTLVFAIVQALPLAGQNSAPVITYIPGSSVKLYQINGDCDWVAWNATINNKTPTCKSTTSQPRQRPMSWETTSQLPSKTTASSS